MYRRRDVLHCIIFHVVKVWSPFLLRTILTLFIEPEIFQYFDKHEYVDLLASTMERHKTNKEIQKFACELMEYLFELRHNGTENGVIC